MNSEVLEFKTPDCAYRVRNLNKQGSESYSLERSKADDNWDVIAEYNDKAEALRNFSSAISATAGLDFSDERRKVQLERDRVMSTISHELKGPLSSILFALDMNKRLPHGEDVIGAISESAERMNGILGTLSDAAKIQSKNFALNIEPVDLNSILVEAAAKQAEIAEQKDIKIELRLSDLPKLKADKKRLSQVVNNILSNAVKFGSENGTVVVASEALKKKVRFSISDDGIGISDEDLPRIFERFWTGGAASRYGIGLGLPISKALVEVHGGTIDVKSVVGKGSTFTVTLPVGGE